MNYEFYKPNYNPGVIEKPYFNSLDASPINQEISGSGSLINYDILKKVGFENLWFDAAHEDEPEAPTALEAIGILRGLDRFLLQAEKTGLLRSILEQSGQVTRHLDLVTFRATTGTAGLLAGQDKGSIWSQLGFPFDAHFGFVMFYEDMAVSAVAFNQIGSGVEIKQIQGVKGNKQRRALHRIGRWEDVAVALVEGYARSAWLEEVCIQPGQENHWAKSSIRLGTGLTDQAKSRYDEIARRRGYYYNGLRRRFIKPIRSPFEYIQEYCPDYLVKQEGRS